MKEILSIKLFLLYVIISAQTNNLVEYSFTFKDGTGDIQNEYLVFNESEIYYANIANPSNLDYEDNKFDKTGIQYEPIYMDIKKDSLYQLKIGIFSKNSSELKRFVASEKRPIINWKITKESQKILGNTAYKATTTFRGRDYIAWFAPDLPYNYGPWKLSGLPGLILKVVNELGDYEAKRIVLNSEKFSGIDHLKKMSEAKSKHTLRESLDYEDNWLEYQLSNVIANLPVGVKIQERPLRGNVRELTIDE